MNKKKSIVYSASWCILLAFLVVFSTIAVFDHSLAWFADNKAVRADGNSVRVNDVFKYMLATKGTKDDLLQDYTLNDKTFVQGTLQDGYYVTEPNMLIRLRTNDIVGGNEYLAPTSSGELTFYIISKEQANGETVNVKLDLSGYVESDHVLTRSGNAGMQELLKGHILFFKTKTGDRYGDFLEDGVLSVEIADSVVEVTVHWIWVGLFSDYTNSEGWNEQDYNEIVQSITADIDNDQNDESYNSKYFSQIVESEMYIDRNQVGQAWHGDHIEWSRKAYLSDKYNEADQMIGLEFDFILLEIILEQ